MATKSRAVYRVNRIRSGLLNAAGRMSNVVRHGRAYPSMGHPVFIDPRALAGRPSTPFTCTCKNRDLRTAVRGLTCDGDWDLAPLPLPKNVVEYKAYYDAGRDAQAEERLKAHIESQIRYEEAVETHTASRLKKANKIYDSIRLKGFQPFEGARGLAKALPLGLRGFLPHGISSIRVAVTRDGRLLWVGSQHRMAVALSLGLNNVPATICAVHPEWNGQLHLRLPESLETQ